MPRDDVFAATSLHAQTSATALDDLMTIADVAALLKVSKSWVYEHTRDGVEDRLPAVKLGKFRSQRSSRVRRRQTRRVSPPVAPMLTALPCQR